MEFFNRPPEVSKNESEPLIWWANHLCRLAVRLYRDLRAKWDHRLFNRIRLAYGAFSAWRVRRLTCFTDGKSCDSDWNSLIKVSVHDTVNIINCALDDLLCIHKDPFEQQALILDLSRAPAKQKNSYFPFYHSQMNAQQVLHTSELCSKLMFVFELFCTIYTKYVWSDNILFCSKQKRKREGKKNKQYI